jgi:hypothetical protein
MRFKRGDILIHESNETIVLIIDVSDIGYTFVWTHDLSETRYCVYHYVLDERYIKIGKI